MIRFVIWRESDGGIFNNGIGTKYIRGKRPHILSESKSLKQGVFIGN